MIDQRIERKNAAEFWAMRRILMLLGILFLTAGGLGIVRPLLSHHGQGLNIAAVAPSALAVILGIWMLRYPSPHAFVVLCLMFVVSGIQFPFDPLFRRQAGPAWPSFLIWSGLIAAGWCTVFFLAYRRFRHLAGVDLPPAMLAEMGSLARQAAHGESGEGTKAARLRILPGLWWSIACFDDEMIMVLTLANEVLMMLKIGLDLRYARRDEVRLRDNGATLFGSGRKVEVQIGARNWKGSMNADQWAHLASWAETGSAGI